jgi:hypothetical protein
LSETAKSIAKSEPMIAGSECRSMKLAAHFCGSRVNEVLKGDDNFVKQVKDWGFQRIQINATAVNGVDTSDLAGAASHVIDVASRHSDLEFILQKNEETQPLWEGILVLGDVTKPEKGPRRLPINMTMLLDESKGAGVLSKTFPSPPKEYDVGYAGGIGPSNIKDVLNAILTSASGRSVWIDMESSLRSFTNSQDVFDLNKCYSCILVACELNLFAHPEFLVA